MMNFKEWLNEAVISRQTLTLDKDDIKYLKQFPLNQWGVALKYRYNDAILNSVSHGELKPEFHHIDHLDIPMKKEVKTVWFGLHQLFNKLKKAGYDFSGTNSINRESLFYSPMNILKAQQLASQLKNTDPNYTEATKKLKGRQVKYSSEINPVPDVVKFSPNKLKTARNDAEISVPGGSALNDKFQKERPEITAEVEANMSKLLNSRHPNAVFWRQHEKFKQLVEKVVNRIFMSWADMQMHDKAYRKKIILAEFRKAMQGGLITRRVYEKLKLNYGVDVATLFHVINPATNTPWDILHIDNVLRKSDSYEEMAQKFKDGHKEVAAA